MFLHKSPGKSITVAKTMDTREISFNHIYNVDMYMKHDNKIAVSSARYLEVFYWLKEHIGEHYVDFHLAWATDRKHWVLALHNECDWIAFKLKFTVLGHQ